MGWDVGGAHLKAARIEADGALSGAWQVPCPLWRGMDELDRAMARLLEQSSGASHCHGITMTGEMTDLFSTREAGVRTLADAMGRHLAPDPVRFFAGADGWVDGTRAAATHAGIASANWFATARLLAGALQEGLLVDIGSTTTDIIPIANGRVATASRTDADRLQTGELVYTGVVRTPVMALAHQAPVEGHMHRLMAEHFATSADVYRILGWLPEDADQHPSADNGPKTPEASRLRLGRMVGRDGTELTEAAWTGLAAWFAQAQLEHIEHAARQVLSRTPLGPRAPLVMAGVGAFLAPRLGARLERPVLAFHEAIPGLGETHGWTAPAVAVARLLMEDKACV